MHHCTMNRPAMTVLFQLAQAGDPVSLDTLMQLHDGLVHHFLRRQWTGALSYDEVLQEGRIGLWQAILHFDPERGLAFSSYAALAITRHIWRGVRQSSLSPLGQGWLEPVDAPDPEADLLEQEVEDMLRALVDTLPPLQWRVVQAYYGLDGQGGRDSGQLGRLWGCSQQAVRAHLQRALTHLRHPAFSAALRALLECNRRADYLAALQPRRKP